MSKKKRHRNEDGGGDAGHAAGRAPGKGTRSGKLSAPESEAASTDAPGADGSDAEIGADDLAPAAAAPSGPRKAHIIDLAMNSEGTQVAVSQGSDQGISMGRPASLILPDGSRFARATIMSVGASTTYLNTPKGIEEIEDAHAMVKFD